MIFVYCANIDESLTALFPDFKMDEEIIKFYKLVYNMGEPVIQKNILSRMKGEWN